MAVSGTAEHGLSITRVGTQPAFCYAVGAGRGFFRRNLNRWRRGVPGTMGPLKSTRGSYRSRAPLEGPRWGRFQRNRAQLSVARQAAPLGVTPPLTTAAVDHGAPSSCHRRKRLARKSQTRDQSAPCRSSRALARSILIDLDAGAAN
jgi:hypothetical protein